MFLDGRLITFLVAMTPISELRGAIPLALGFYKLSVYSAFFWAVAGNLLSTIIVLLILEPITNYIYHHNYYLNRFFSWLFEMTRKKHSHKFEIWGAVALVTFVAIPLPLTGAWSGAIAAFVFGIPFKKSFPLIALGVIIAALIVTFVSLGLLKFNI